MVRVGGLSYSIAPNAAMGSRITRMTLRGKPIEAAKKYRVAGWAAVTEEARAAGGEPIWEVVARHLRAKKTIARPKLNLPVVEGMTGNLGMS